MNTQNRTEPASTVPAAPASRSLRQVLKRALGDWIDDKAMSLSAAIAFYTLFSVIPLVMIAVSIGSMVFGEHLASTEMRRQLAVYLGPQGARWVIEVLGRALSPQSSWPALAVSTVVFVFGATAMFSQIQQALNTVWKVSPPPAPVHRQFLDFLRRKVLAFLMVAVSGILLFVSLAVGTAWMWMRHYLTDMPRATAWSLFRTYHMAVTFVVLSVLLMLIYKLLPEASIVWRDVWVGAVATAGAMMLGETLISMYVVRMSLASAYGAAGSLVIILIWAYYSAMVFMLGAEVTHVYASTRHPHGCSS